MAHSCSETGVFLAGVPHIECSATPLRKVAERILDYIWKEALQMEFPEVWARAEEHFAQRPDTDMRAHAEAVVKWAEALMEAGEPGEPEVIIPAAILHDVGIPRAIALYGSSGPPGQEVEGAVVAGRILTELNWQPQRIEAICGIIARHHHRPDHPTPEFRVIYDADLLVNAQEAGLTYEQVAGGFYSAAARRLSMEVLREAGPT